MGVTCFIKHSMFFFDLVGFSRRGVSGGGAGDGPWLHAWDPMAIIAVDRCAIKRNC